MQFKCIDISLYQFKYSIELGLLLPSFFVDIVLLIILQVEWIIGQIINFLHIDALIYFLIDWFAEQITVL